MLFLGRGRQESNKIRELYRVSFEMMGKKSDGMGKKQEIETEWELIAESRKVNSADQIDQLGDWRFKTQMASRNLSREKSMIFRKSKFIV